jgi:hypothetical protein
MRRLSSLVILFTLLASTAVFSQTSAPAGVPIIQPVPEVQRASIDEVRALFAALNVQQQSEQMVKVMRVQVTNAFTEEMKKQSPPPSPREMQLVRQYMDEALSGFDIKALMNDMAGVYQEYLTRDEILAMTAFYKSPAGKSMLTKMPAIMSEYMRIAMPKQMEKVQASIKNLEQQMKKERQLQGAPKAN